MARVLRWSAAVAAFAIPVVIIVSAITEPMQSMVFDCSDADSACDPVFAARAHRWGPLALLAIVLWIVIALLAAAIIDHVEGKERRMDVLTSK